MTDVQEPIAEASGVPPASGLAPYEPAQTQADVASSRTFLQQTLRDTFGQPGARVGLVWIGILATLGVFAPFIANSEPWLVKTNGRVFSPLLRSLTAPDITLAAIYIATMSLLVWRKFSLSR